VKYFKSTTKIRIDTCRLFKLLQCI